MDEFGWHLQVVEAEWIFWGYGRKRLVTHIAPTEQIVKFTPTIEVRVAFTLPDLTERGLPKGVEYERRQGFGWRFRSNNRISDTTWRFAESRVEAVRDAASFAHENTFADTISRQNKFIDAMNDIRESQGAYGLW